LDAPLGGKAITFPTPPAIRTVYIASFPVRSPIGIIGKHRLGHCHIRENHLPRHLIAPNLAVHNQWLCANPAPTVSDPKSPVLGECDNVMLVVGAYSESGPAPGNLPVPSAAQPTYPVVKPLLDSSVITEVTDIATSREI
jgi:hypothetical protein